MNIHCSSNIFSQQCWPDYNGEEYENNRFMHRQLGEYCIRNLLFWFFLDELNHLFQSLLGENRQRYLDKIQERLKARKKKVLEGEIDEDDEELMEDDENVSSGNILKDLQMRYEQEKDALLRRLQVFIYLVLFDLPTLGFFSVLSWLFLLSNNFLPYPKSWKVWQLLCSLTVDESL